MGIFDLLAKAQAEATAKVERLQKKIEGASEQLTVENLINQKEKEKTKEKPDLSIEGISAQIIKQRDSIRRNGFKEYEFIANRDCCAICAALNKKHFPISKMKIGVNAPPMHDRCKCSIAAYMDVEEYEDWLDFLDKGGTSKQFEANKKNKR